VQNAARQVGCERKMRENN